jgi:CBS domain containing-hemolysin-like protein
MAPGADSMILFVVAILCLVGFGTALALAEASISRMTQVHALALREQGYRNAGLLVDIESEPARHLNAIYLSVMLAQNGSAILAAILADIHLGGIGVTIASILFTLGYFVVVEAMAKTFAILHCDRVALVLAPFVWLLGRALVLPTRALIGLANVLLPGKGLKEGPFAAEHEIRSLAEVGHQEGVIEEHEKEIIHSVFQFGDLSVHNVMVPRPDMVAIDLASPLSAAAELIVQRGFTRIPAYRGDLDRIEGIVHAKDVLDLLHQGRLEVALTEILRPVRFVPESKRLAELLREMQAEKFHLAVVSDEYGSVAGLVTLEDLLEELVGQISDEHEGEAAEITPLGDGRYRVNATLPTVDLDEVLGVALPRDHWNTVGGLVFGLAGTIPPEGATFEVEEFRFTVEKVQGRRILTVLVERQPARVGKAVAGESG